MSFQPYPGFAALVGKTLTKIDGGKDSDMLTFHTTEGETYKMYHSQSCCETVYLEDVAGELSDLIGSPIIRAEENSNDDPDLLHLDVLPHPDREGSGCPPLVRHQQRLLQRDRDLQAHLIGGIMAYRGLFYACLFEAALVSLAILTVWRMSHGA
jgi:hypothetical protein